MQLFKNLVVVLAAVLAGTSTVYSLTHSQIVNRKYVNRKYVNRKSPFTPVDENKYPDNMTMVIELRKGSQVIDTCEVAAFIDGECRGVARAIGRHYYLVIAGEGSGQQVDIVTCIKDRILTIDSSVSYVSDLNVGTSWEPYVISLDKVFADVNGDGAVDVADIAAIISTMANGGTDPVSARSADVNGDGTVDVADIAAIISTMAASARG